MWTFRKALVAAAVLLTLFLFLRSSHTPSQLSPIDTKGATSQAKAPVGATTEGNPDVKVEAESVAPPPAPEKRPPTQQLLEDVSGKPLREQLRFIFPYDLESKFPAYIWQTWKYTPADGNFAENLRPFEASWSEKHPGFIHEVVNDEQADHLIKYLYAAVPRVYEAYSSLPVPVLKADFFRYLILLARGGIYSDIDTIALKPTMEWLPEGFKRENIGLVIGIEADAADRPDWSRWYSRRVQFCQWTIQSKPGHPVLLDIVNKVTEDTLRMKKDKVLREGKMDKSIVEFTGPGAWTDSVMDYFNNARYFDLKGKNITSYDFANIESHKQVGDVMVLPITSFSPGVGQMGSKEPDHPMAFVKHEFEGVWKPDEERKIGH